MTKYKTSPNRSRKVISYNKIQRAVAKFISTTQKIVQKIHPGAHIVIPSSRSTRCPRQSKPSYPIHPTKPQINTPTFQEIQIANLSDSNSSFEDTDDELYISNHEANEHIEALAKFPPDLRRIKGGGRSAHTNFTERRSEENFEANLMFLSEFVDSSTIEEYRIENIHLLEMPVREPEVPLDLNPYSSSNMND